jgi:hypothetical protein
VPHGILRVFNTILYENEFQNPQNFHLHVRFSPERSTLDGRWHKRERLRDNFFIVPFTFNGFFQFVCMGGTPNRMESFAKLIMKELGYKIPTGTDLVDISRHSHRYT